MTDREDAARHITAVYRVTPSPFGARVAELLGYLLRGLHHLPHQKKTDWTDSRYIRVSLYGSFDTYDFDQLTRLVFLAHALCIRVEVSGGSFKYLHLSFSRRTNRDGSMYERHPTIETALAKFRETFPASADETTSKEEAPV